MIAQEHGIIVSDSIISAWQSGENAIASYGEVLTSQSSAFIGNIMDVQNYVYGLQAQANSTADSLSWMFSTRADNLVNQLTSSYHSEENLNAMTNTLQNSLINTLERGYNINSITDALSSIASGADAVTSAANKAAQALASMGAAQSGVGSISDAGSSGRKYAVSINGERVSEYFSSKQEADKWIDDSHASRSRYYVTKYAKGGIITKDKSNPLNRIAESVGEDTLIAGKEGEGVLTKEQTKALTDFTETIEKDKSVPAKDNESTLNDRQRKMLSEYTNAVSGGNVGIPYLNLDLESSASSVIPSSVRNNTNNITEFVKTDKPSSNINIRYDSLLTVNGDINDTKHFTKQVTGCIEDTLNRINRDFRIHCK